MSATQQEISDQSACLACVPDPWAALLYLYSNGMTPQQIATAAACFECIPNKQAAMLYLLALRAGQTDPAVIADQARCFSCVPDQMAALLYLSEQITMNCNPFATTTPSDYDINSAFGYNTSSTNFPGLLSLNFLPATSVAGFTISGQASLLVLTFPNLTTLPAVGSFIAGSNLVLNTISAPLLSSAGNGVNITSNTLLTVINLPVLASVGATSSISSNPALISVSLPSLTTAAAGLFSIASNTLLTTINLPLLATVANGLTLNLNPALTTVNLPNLVSVNNGFTFQGDTALVTISLPSLVTAALASSNLNFSGCTLLQNVSFPNYLPTNGRAQNFSACALTQASVDLILARCVANAAYVSGTINLSGGTSATPSAAGLADKATLIGRGCTVTTN